MSTKVIEPYDLAQLRADVAALWHLPGEVPVKIEGAGPEIYGMGTESTTVWSVVPGDPPVVGITHVVIHGG